MLSRGKLEDEELLISRAKRILLEIKVSQTQGQLIHIDDVAREINTVLNATRQHILSIPRKAAPILRGVETDTDREKILQDLIYDALNELANIPYSEEYDEGVPTEAPAEDVEQSKTAAPANRKRVGGRKKNAKPGKQRRKRKVANKSR